MLRGVKPRGHEEPGATGLWRLFFYQRILSSTPKLLQGRRFSNIHAMGHGPTHLVLLDAKDLSTTSNIVNKLMSLTSNKSSWQLCLMSSKSRWVSPILVCPIFYDKFFSPQIWSLGVPLFVLQCNCSTTYYFKEGPISLLFLF